MKEITSKDNRIYKKCFQLGQKKYRDKEEKFIVEGEKSVKEAYKSGRTTLIVVNSDYGGKYDFDEANTVFMTGKLFNKVAQTETSQGIAAIVNKKEPENFMNRNQGNIVVLDKVQDPGNIGTIIRTAEAAGYSGIITIKGTADVYSPKVVRAAAGAMLRMPIMQVEDAQSLIEILAKENKTITATSLDAETLFYDADLSKNVALIIGNEGNGVDPLLQQQACVNIKIPMEGETESLNAAVAAGILMYQSIKKG